MTMIRFWFPLLFICCHLFFSTWVEAQCITFEIAANGVDDDCDPSTSDASGVRLHQPLMSSDTDFTDFTLAAYTAGEAVDWVDFGYVNYSEASGDTADPDGDLNDISDSMGVHNVEVAGSADIRDYNLGLGRSATWYMTVPSEGYYLINFHAWCREGRPLIGYYIVDGQQRDLARTVTRTNFWLLHFPRAGSYQFGVVNAPYLFHSVLYATRPHCSERSDSAAHPLFVDDISRYRSSSLPAWADRLRSDVIRDANTVAATILDGDTSRFLGCDARGTLGAFFDLGAGYSATGDSSIAQATTQALETFITRPHIHCGPSWSSLEKGELLRGASFAYDVVASEMNSDKRQEIGCGLDKHANFLAKHAFLSRHRGDNEYWYSAPTTNNWGFVITAGGVGAAGVALQSFSPDASQWIDMAKQTTLWGMQYFSPHGYWFGEGLTYANYAYSSLIPFLDGLSRADDPQFFDTVEQTLRKNAYLTVYTTDARLWNNIPFSHYSTYWSPSRYRYMHLWGRISWIGGRLQDGILEDYLERRYGYYGAGEDDSAATRLHDYSAGLPTLFLGYRPTVRTAAADWDLPLGRSFPEGLSVSRTGGWDAIDASILAVMAEDVPKRGHHEPEQLTFYYEAQGQPLIAAVSRGSSSLRNVVTVDGLDQAVLSSDEFENVRDVLSGMRKFLSTPSADIISADAPEVYRSQTELSDITTARRSWVFPRRDFQRVDAQQYLVVVDRFVSDTPSASHQYEWNISSPPGFYAFSNTGTKTYRAISQSTPGVQDNIAELDYTIFFESAEADGASYSIGDNLLSISPSLSSANLTSAALIAAHPSSASSPSVQRIRTNSYIGYTYNGDTILVRSASGSQSYQEMTTDAEIAVLSHGGGSLGAWVWLSLYEAGSFELGGITLHFSTPQSIVLRRTSRGDLELYTGNERGNNLSFAITIDGVPGTTAVIGNLDNSGQTQVVTAQNGTISWETTDYPQKAVISSLPPKPRNFRVISD